MPCDDNTADLSQDRDMTPWIDMPTMLIDEVRQSVPLVGMDTSEV